MSRLLLVSILILSLALVGCTAERSTPGGSEVNDDSIPAAAQKQGDTTKTGKISSANGAYFITVTGQAPEAIDSYAVDLAEYVGQTVTVTGQYSGDTLFVGSVE